MILTIRKSIINIQLERIILNLIIKLLRITLEM